MQEKEEESAEQKEDGYVDPSPEAVQALFCTAPSSPMPLSAGATSDIADDAFHILRVFSAEMVKDESIAETMCILAVRRRMLRNSWTRDLICGGQMVEERLQPRKSSNGWLVTPCGWPHQELESIPPNASVVKGTLLASEKN